MAEVRWDEANRVWYARKYLGRAPDGRRVYPRKSFPSARCREEAQELADLWERHLTADGTVRSALLPDLLAEYIDSRARNGASPNTVRGWRSYLSRHIAPAFAGRTAGDLVVLDFHAFEQRLLMERTQGGAGLSRSTVNCIHQFLRGAYNHLARSGLVASNPLALVAHPRPERHEAEYLGEHDLAACERELRQRAAGPGCPTREQCCAFAAWLSLHSGMRCGEVLALRVRDVSRAHGFIHVGGTVVEVRGAGAVRRDVTKGRKCRNVAMTEDDLAFVADFVRRTEERGRVAGDSPLVSPDGSFMRPSTVSRAFSRIARATCLPKGFTFHGLRHTHATWCLMSGVDPKTLSERLGHADAATTLRVYAHVMPGRDPAAARAVADAIRGVCGGVTT